MIDQGVTGGKEMEPTNNELSLTVELEWQADVHVILKRHGSRP